MTTPAWLRSSKYEAQHEHVLNSVDTAETPAAALQSWLAVLQLSMP